MNDIARLFYSIGEPYAAGVFEEPERSYFYRHALGHARYFEALSPTPYDGETLYPCGRKFFENTPAMMPHYAHTYVVDWPRLEAKSAEAARILKEFTDISHYSFGWLHGAPNYKRIVKEGLNSYRTRVLARPEGEDFREGLLALLDGMESFVRRSADYLESIGAPARLTAAVRRVPFAPAQTYYEGLVSWNLIFYFDGCDNLGYLDDGLAHLYAGEDLTEVIRQLFSNIDAMGYWSCTIGAKYNEITRQALRAIKGKRRPLLELRVTEDMPQDLWDIAAENLRDGTTHPSFYNDKGIRDMLKARWPHIPDEDLALFVGCGCTETNLQGLSRSGGTDENIPLLLIFEEYLHANLAAAKDFDEFYEGFCVETEHRIDAQLDLITEYYEYNARYLAHPMRTLFTDDCIEKGKDYHAGGARYTWTQSSDSGLINVADSLLAVKELVFDRKKYTPEDFLAKLSAEDPVLYRDLRSCPCFGVDNEQADALAAAYAERVYMVYRNKKSNTFIDGYILTEHQFLRYESEGLRVGPTPDGRKAGDPTCDSIAALRGKACAGPTAMLCSASRLPQHLADGISVLNLTLNKGNLDKALRPLVEGYFAMGGIQVQVTVTSPEELQDALVNPDKHRDLIVRVGGYSDYFVNLSPALRKAVVERDVHAL